MLAPSIFAPRRYPRPGHRVERGVSDDEGEEEWERGRGAHRGGEGGSLLRGVRVLHRPWLESSGGRVGGKHARGLEGRRRRAAEMRRSLSPRLSLTAPREQPGPVQHTSGDTPHSPMRSLTVLGATSSALASSSSPGSSTTHSTLAATAVDPASDTSYAVAVARPSGADGDALVEVHRLAHRSQVRPSRSPSPLPPCTCLRASS